MIFSTRMGAMSYRNDKVSDVIKVLSAMRREYNKTSRYRNTSVLRMEAVRYVAETELLKKRYKNQDSALKTIHDACARRLKPEIRDIKDFDRFANQWIRHGDSINLKDILLGHSNSRSQRALVVDFFGGGKLSE